MLRAKLDGTTLKEHTDHALTIFHTYWQENSRLWPQLARRLQTTPKTLKDAAVMAITAHDWGKATPQFQDAVEKQKKASLFHAPISAYLFARLQPPAHLKEWMPLIVLAILSHHNQLNQHSLDRGRFVHLDNITLLKKDLEKDWPELNTAPEIIYLEDIYRLGRSLKEYINNAPPARKKMYKARYCWLHALLRWVDNLASRGYHPKDSEKSLPAFQSFSNNTGRWQKETNSMQQEVVQSPANFLLIQGGCGSGKTGAALLWAQKLWEQGKIERLIFTLPTQFTSNSLYWDFTSRYGFPNQAVGIYHSDVDSILRLQAEEEEMENWAEEKYFNTFYQKPINVSTVDHLLYSLLHCYRYADRAFGNLVTAAVVFDEIHYYDRYTLAKIGQAMSLLKDLDIPHLVMSATIPKAIAEKWKKQGYQLIEHNDDSSQPVKIEKLNQPAILENHVSDELMALVEANLFAKQMLVVNQVERAKMLAKTIQKRWSEVEVICYHSEFTREDRQKKERLIREKFRSPQGKIILVSTQVCEMSLDISADVLYTEAAPVDAVIQRLGRIHRRGRKPQKSDCGCDYCQSRTYLPADFIYRAYVLSLPFEDRNACLPYEQEILEESWKQFTGVFSSSKGKDWVNAVYLQAPPLTDDIMLQMFLEDVVFGRSPIERYGDEEAESSSGSFRVRKSEVQTISTVPASLWSNQDEFQNFIVKVSLNKVRKFKVPRRWEKGVCILDLPYSCEFGYDFLATDAVKK